MNETSTPDRSLRGLWKWATTRPQAYALYVIALILVYGISYMAGTMKPKHTPSPAATSAPVSVPQR